MKELFERVAPVKDPAGVIELCFDDRQKARLRTRTSAGEEVGIYLERGTSLRDGEHMRSRAGEVYRIVALPEGVSSVSAHGLDLARIAYHLGNRHVKVELGEGFLRYQADPVLDEMVRRLGFTVTAEVAPFEPEGGAYSHGSHSHGEPLSFEVGHPHFLHQGQNHDHHHGHHDHSHGHGHHHARPADHPRTSESDALDSSRPSPRDRVVHAEDSRGTGGLSER